MNCKTFSIYVFFCITLHLPAVGTKAQCHDDGICLAGGKREIDYRKKKWKGNNAFLFEYLQKIKYFEDTEKVRYLVPVKFWAYRQNNGTGGPSHAEIKNLMADLNHFNSINHTGIQFYLREIKYIDKTARQVFGYYVEAPLQTVIRHTKPALNVYIIENFKKKHEARRVVRGTYNIMTKSVIIQRENSRTALSHEVGHYFGLLHPHRHHDFGKSKQEPVSRTRTNKKGEIICESRGDLLSDTPAEPNLTFLVDNDCNFIGTSMKDAWGDNYNSVVDNIMSYPTHHACRNAFTLQQKAVMLYSASENRYAKYWTTDDERNHKYFFDTNEPDNSPEMAGEIIPGEEKNLNFHKIFLNKGKDITDSCDWITFEVKNQDKKNIRVVITPNATNTQNLAAVLYDKNQFALAKMSTSRPNEKVELGFQNVVSDWYYVKLAPLGNEFSEHIDNYSVVVYLE
jgi:hypothetical protein